MVDRRLLALEITARGEDGHNGMKSQVKGLCGRFDQFEKKAIRLIAVGTVLPGDRNWRGGRAEVHGETLGEIRILCGESGTGDKRLRPLAAWSGGFHCNFRAGTLSLRMPLLHRETPSLLPFRRHASGAHAAGSECPHEMGRLAFVGRPEGRHLS